MGLHPCPPHAWLWWTAAAQELVAAKAQVLRDHHDQAVAITDAGDAAAREAAHLLLDHVRVMCERTGEPPPQVNLSTQSGDEHPLEAVARVIAEDVCIMTPTRRHAEGDSGGKEQMSYVLTAAVLCAPSRWSLREKLGLDVTAIHDPVPGYDAIAAPTARFFERLRVDDIIERTNWTVLDSPVLFQPDRARATMAFLVAGAGAGAARLDLFWLRLERQTLRKLPYTGAVVFTILTTNTRLDDLAQSDPEVAYQLAHKMRTAPASTCEYKGWENSASNIADALEAACSAA